MTVLRDWPRTLRPAKYRSTSFFVERDQIKTGRRLVVHEFPHKDDPYIEDLGRDANRITVTAYVVGDDADDHESALRRDCEMGGPASLTLPIGRFTAHCESCDRTFSKDKLGYIAFELTFVREGVGAAPFPVPYLAQLASWGAAGLIKTVLAAAGQGFATLGWASFVGEQAAATIRDVAATLDTVARAAPLDAGKAPSALQLIADLYLDADTLAVSGARGNRYEGLAFVAEEETVASDFPADVAAIMAALADALTPETARPVLTTLAAYGLDVPLGPTPTPSSRQSAQNDVWLALTVRSLAIAELAQAVVADTYPDRRSAISARATVASTIGAEIDRASELPSPEIVDGLADLLGRTVENLSCRIADLAPVTVVSAPLSMPSLWWAWRLYGDPLRATELATRNAVIHPMFMPVSFEALAS